MAYDPQDPLSSISNELAKRNKKNPNARVAYQVGPATGAAPGTDKINPRKSGMFQVPSGQKPYGLTSAENKQILSDIAESERQAGRPINVNPPQQATSNPAVTQPRPANTPSVETQRFINRLHEGGLPESTYTKYPQFLDQVKQNKVPYEFQKVAEQDARYNYTQTPEMTRDIQAKLPPAVSYQAPEPSSYTGLMSRGVPAPGMTQVGSEIRPNIPPYVSGNPNDQAMILSMDRAMGRMGYPTSRRPEQAAQVAPEANKTLDQTMVDMGLRNRSFNPQPLPQEAGKTLDQTMIDMGLRNRSFNPNPTPQQQVAQPAAPVAQAPASPVAQAAQMPPAVPTMQQPQAPAYVSQAAAIRDELRQQIASEQRALLDARRGRGGMYGDGGDAESLERINRLRRELAPFESAASLPTRTRIKTPEENVLGERDIAGQAARILDQDASNLREAIKSMPDGSEKQAAMSKLADIESRQRQMSSRAQGQPGMQEEAQARTQRQTSLLEQNRRAGEIAFSEGQRLRTKRIDEETTKKQETEAANKARLFDLGKGQREFEQQQKEQDLNTEERKAKIAQIASATKLTEAQAGLALKQAEAAMANMPTPEEAKLSRQQTLEAQRLENEALKNKNEAQRRSMNGYPMTEEDIKKQTIVQESLAKNTGTTVEDEQVAATAIQMLGRQTSMKNVNGKMAYAAPADAIEGIQHVNKISYYINNLKKLSQTGPEGKKLAALKAGNLLSMMPGEFGGSRPSGTGLAGSMGGGAAGGAAIGAAVGSVIPVAGTAVGAGIGAIVGGISAGIAYAGFATDEEANRVVSGWNDSYRALQEIANGQ